MSSVKLNGEKTDGSFSGHVTIKMEDVPEKSKSKYKTLVKVVAVSQEQPSPDKGEKVGKVLGEATN